MSKNYGIPGEWSNFSCDISPQAADVFAKALDGSVEVSYTPIAVATQVVEGTNYSFFCNAQIVSPNPLSQAALINIYQPLEGLPRVTEIQMLDPYILKEP